MANATILFGTDIRSSAGISRSRIPTYFYRVRLAFAGAERVREETRRIWNGAVPRAPGLKARCHLNPRP